MNGSNSGQGPQDTLEAGLLRWLSIAERQSNKLTGYTLYPGDWAALADKLRRSLRIIKIHGEL